MKTGRPRWLLPAAVFAAALLLRVAFLAAFRHTALFDPSLMDAHDQQTFHERAVLILRHPWFVDGRPFYMAPLYFYVLAALYAVSGSSVLFAAAAGAVLDAGTCVLLYDLGRRLFGRTAGLVAGLLAAFYGVFVLYSTAILSDALILFLYTAFIWAVHRALPSRAPRRWILPGILLGLAALAKPTIGLFLPFLLAGLLLYPRERTDDGNPWVAFAVCAGVSALVILPVTVRNWTAGGAFVPICTNGPINWQIGNSADSLGLFCYPKGPLLGPLSGAFWRLQLLKLHFFFTSYEWPQNLNVYLVQDLAPVLKAAWVRFGLIVPIGFAGLIAACRPIRRNFLFVSFTVTNIVWVVLFFVTDRYRMPAVACLAVAAGCAVAWSVARVRARAPVPVLAAWAGVGLFAFFFNTTPGPRIPEVYYRIFAGLSVKNVRHAVAAGDAVRAHRMALDHIRLVPGDPAGYLSLAEALAAAGRIDDAAAVARRLVELQPDYEPGAAFLRTLEGRPRENRGEGS